MPIDNRIVQQLRKYNLDKYTDYQLSERQIFLLTVLAEEIEQWEDTAYCLMQESYTLTDRVGFLRKKSSKQKFWQKLVYHKIRGRPTPLEEEIRELDRQLAVLKKRIDAHNLKEPNINGFELAVLGNRIFGIK